jgi:hypothetical protein
MIIMPYLIGLGVLVVLLVAIAVWHKRRVDR